MAERQYIGARYVPTFFNNTATGDATWAPGVQYEPLTMVTWMNNTYTSKKPVPTNIGQPNTAPEYWVATGMFNEQVDALRARIDTLEGKFPIQTESLDDGCVTTDKINKGITIIIADSYGYHPSLSTSWVAILAKKLGIASNSDTFNNGTNVVNDNLITSIYGNRGFGTDTLSSPATFKDQLTDAIALVDNPDDIVRIIVCGGTNDMADYDTTKIRNGINAFCTLANSLKNAKTYCGMIGNLIDPNYPTDNYQNVQYLYSLGDYIYMDGIECICKLRANLESDGQHPNTDGSRMLGKALYNFLETGSMGYWDLSFEETAVFTDGTNNISIRLLVRFNKDTTIIATRANVESVPKPTGNYSTELSNMAFVAFPSTLGRAIGLAPANSSTGEAIIATFCMRSALTAYKGHMILALFGNTTATNNFIGQTTMTMDSHYWH